MSRSERWLHAFGHALASHSLYGPGHQARRESSARLYGALRELLDTDLRPAFTFLDDAVIYRAAPLPGLRDWTWGRRLGAIGVRRLEFTTAATLESLDQLLATLHRRLNGEAGETATIWPGIEAGDIEVGSERNAPGVRETSVRPYGLGLDEELAVMRWCCERVAGGHPVPLDEVTALVRALGLALKHDEEGDVPRIEAGAEADAQARHGINSALLALRLGEWLGFGGAELRAIGRAALLHDIGMTRVPDEVFAVEALSDAGRHGVARHPEEGARLLLRQADALELAAISAYEHHLRMDGTGYPARRIHGEAHYVSRLIALCGAYDALRSARCYRPARGHAAALAELEAGRGTIYDPELLGAFGEMLRTKPGARSQ